MFADIGMEVSFSITLSHGEYIDSVKCFLASLERHTPSHLVSPGCYNCPFYSSLENSRFPLQLELAKEVVDTGEVSGGVSIIVACHVQLTPRN